MESTLKDLDHEWSTWDLDQLVQEISEHNRRYWDEDQPSISDYDYDRLVERLRVLNANHPLLKNLGPSIGAIGEAVTHQSPMLSLDKCYQSEDLLKWAHKLKSAIIMSPKIDGVACSLRYNTQGHLYLAATRGDGVMGENITVNVLPMSSIPQTIPEGYGDLEIRGEIYLPLSAFKRLGDRFANPRNAVAGTLKRKEKRYAEEIGLRFYAYDVYGLSEDSAYHRLHMIKKWGFTPVPSEILAIEALQQGYESYVQQRDQLDYEIDGVVYRSDSHQEYLELGFTAHHPRAAIAYKLQGESARTILQQVEWGVSRNGLLTPVGIVAPVKLSGAIVNRISLHNWGLVRAKNLSLGAEVIAMRRGGVIPHLESMVTAGHTVITPPQHCPQCPTLCAPVKVEGDHVFCNYQGVCDPQAAAILKHYVKVSKIEGFGQVWLDTLTHLGILNTPLDLYTLQAKQVIHLEGVGDKRADKWIESVNQARTLSLDVFLCALGVSELGKRASQAIAEHFTSLEAVRQAKVSDIKSLNNFGEITAQHIVEGLVQRCSLIDDLLVHVNVQEYKVKVVTDTIKILKEASFLFTGTLVNMKRKAAQEKVVYLGGVAAQSVNKKLDYLVIGDAGKAGSKLQKSQKLGVTILSESEFITLMKAAEAKVVSQNSIPSVSTVDLEELSTLSNMSLQTDNDLEESQAEEAMLDEALLEEKVLDSSSSESQLPYLVIDHDSTLENSQSKKATKRTSSYHYDLQLNLFDDKS